MKKNTIILIIAALIIISGIYYYSNQKINIEDKTKTAFLNDLKWVDNLKWNAAIALAKMNVEDSNAIKILKSLLKRDYYESYSKTIADFESTHSIKSILNVIAVFDNNGIMIEQYFLKEFESEIKYLMENDQDVEIKGLSKQIYNEIK